MPPRQHGPMLIVRARSAAAQRGRLHLGTRSFPCALGRSGRRVMKREGDGATPIGFWPVRLVYYRADRMLPPPTRVPRRPIMAADGWCDAPQDRNYNRRVRRPYGASLEEMWRRDALYDIVVVLGYNDVPRRRGRGSAIFVHLAREGLQPTEGCIALRRADLLQVVHALTRGARFCIPAR